MRNVTDRNIKDIFLQAGFKEKPQADGAYNLNPYVFEAARALLEFAAAAPVPPVGDVEVLPSRKRIDHYCYDQGNNMLSKGHNECLDAVAPIVTRLTAERDDLKARLILSGDAEKQATEALWQAQSELDKVKADSKRLAELDDLTIKQLGDKLREKQSELTKARELLESSLRYNTECLKRINVNQNHGFCLALGDFIGTQTATPTTRNADESCGQDAEAAKGGA